MTKKYSPCDLSSAKTYPISQRRHKVHVMDFARKVLENEKFSDFLDSLPNILAGRDFRAIVSAVKEARKKGRPVLFCMGAHVIKCGLSPLVIQLMEENIVTAVALNGAGSVHDFEIAKVGETSEVVEEGLDKGDFGMVEETGREMNEAIKMAAMEKMGMGEALGKKLLEDRAPHADKSILAAGARRGLPVTVHVAIGTDTIHMHPTVDARALGEATFTDFRTLTSVIMDLEGGVVFNIGSAVVLPEVFLKAINLARNLGAKVENFTAVDMDMERHYRPYQNVVKRPTGSKGRGYCITGHHEIMLPLLAHVLIDRRDK